MLTGSKENSKAVCSGVVYAWAMGCTTKQNALHIRASPKIAAHSAPFDGIVGVSKRNVQMMASATVNPSCQIPKRSGSSEAELVTTFF